MGSIFEVQLLGEDEEHLLAVCSAALDEIVRIDQLLSRFDARSEISRINRSAAQTDVLVDYELLGILQACRRYWRDTGGYFDIAAATHAASPAVGTPPTFADVLLDDTRRTIRFAQANVQLDLGGFGKGYALDRAAELLRQQQVTRAFLHGGTSSTLAIGCDRFGNGWPIGIRDPFQNVDEAADLCQLRLRDQGSSCSATRRPGQIESDIIDPHASRPLELQAACVVLAGTALEAEILSTALLSMGKSRAAAYIKDRSSFSVGWVEPCDGMPALEWLG
jgi:thiamine biosynthesis lipoprotein